MASHPSIPFFPSLPPTTLTTPTTKATTPPPACLSTPRHSHHLSPYHPLWVWLKPHRGEFALSSSNSKYTTSMAAQEIWDLPSELLGDDFFMEEMKHYTSAHHHHARHHPKPLLTSFSAFDFDDPNLSSTETDDSDEDDGRILTGLTQQMAALSARHHTNKGSPLACSPQSPLCTGLMCSRAQTKVSPPQIPMERPADNVLDLLYSQFQLRKLVGDPRKSATPPCNVPQKNPSQTGMYRNNQYHAHNMHMTQLQQLKQQQLIKQQLAAAWNSHNRVMGSIGTSNTRGGFTGSTWPPPSPTSPPQQAPPSLGPGMRAVYLNGAGGRKRSTGTGVFLPRRAGSPTELPRNKPPTCPPVLVPAKVVQALNMNFENVGAVHPRFPGALYLNQECMIGRSNAAANAQRRLAVPHIPPVGGMMKMNQQQEILLPPEWTY